MKSSARSSTILMFIVFSLSFFVLWSCADLVSRVENQKQGNYTYKNTMTVNVQLDKLVELRENGNQKQAKEYIEKQLEEMISEMNHINDGNVSFSNLFFPVDSKQENVISEIVLKENMVLPYNIQENVDESAPLIIGESLKKYAFDQSKRQCLSVDGEKYSINSILRNYGINSQDERAIILYSKLKAKARENLLGKLREYYFNNYTDGVTITFGSDREEDVVNAYGEFERYTNTLDNVGLSIVPLRSQSGEMNYWYELYHSLFGGISILFAILNGVVVSNLWFNYRKKEYVIRLTFGYKRSRIWFLIWKELGIVSFCSLLFSSILWVLYNFTKKSEISWHMILIQCVVMLLGSLVILFIATIYPLKKIMSLDPAVGLSKSGR